ncbi:MAG: 30S ribosome-binding factor RbfA [Marinilabiliales bacterium]|nr:MAG: 30S ribosome-binding factor RbfA [Marinilabiliales bacterium]
MYSKRQNKVGRLIQKELSEILRQSGNEIHPNTLFTVTVVRLSPDLSVAKAYISLFTNEDKEKVLENLSNSSKNIRHQLAQKIRHQVKKIPELIFYEDDSLDYADRIDKLLNQ